MQVRCVDSVSICFRDGFVGGYIINKKILRKHLAPLFTQSGNIFQMDLIAGSNRINPYFLQVGTRVQPQVACFPKQCCDGLNFIKKYPCVCSGAVNADYYIYFMAMDKTYSTTLPLMKGALESFNSTIDDSHNDIGSKGMAYAELIIRDVYLGKIPLPPYLKLRSDLAGYYSSWTPPTSHYRSNHGN